MKIVKVKVKGIEKRDGYYKVRYCYADMKVGNMPVYASRSYGATDELDALVQFKRSMATVNYEVICDGL